MVHHTEIGVPCELSVSGSGAHFDIDMGHVSKEETGGVVVDQVVRLLWILVKECCELVLGYTGPTYSSAIGHRSVKDELE